MTVLLVLMTLLTFLVIDYIVQKRKARALSRVAVQQAPMFRFSPSLLPPGLLFAPNHLWLRLESDKTITLGLDHFLTGLTGSVEAIELPRTHQRVQRGDKTVVLKGRAGTLTLSAPIEGEVVEVNTDIVHDPRVALESPYKEGWLFRVLPKNLSQAVASFLTGKHAVEWYKQQSERMKEFLLSHLRRVEFATLQDGGPLADGVLKTFDRTVWEEFERQFLHLELPASRDEEVRHER